MGCRYKEGVPVDPLSTPGKYKIESKYGVHSLIISRYDTHGYAWLMLGSDLQQ